MHTSSQPTGADTTAAATAPVASHVREVIEQAVRQGVPGMVAQTRDGHRTCWSTAGVADIQTRRARVPQERFRIGSASKAFTAAVVLQLAAERKLSLDDTVDDWLPGLLHGNGHDGSRITVRHLLRQTSGIFPYGMDQTMLEHFYNPSFLTHRFDRMGPEQLVKIAVSHPAQFQPGESWAYSNTNFILAGMIAEQADGRPFAEQLTERIVRPLRLTGTYMPGIETEIQGVHPRHYSKNTADGSLTAPVHDVTEQNTGHDSHAWTAGGMVSTSGDLDRFLTALLCGELLPPEQQQEMFTTTEVPPQTWIDGTTYGTGIFSLKLPNDRTVWGIAGMIHGCYTFAMGDREGHRTVVTHMNGDWAPAHRPSGIHLMTDVVAAEFS
ncbi:serine hydrolase domain-containing protein [Sphaerisporangium fuscum]|uniref:serine hydrolase domain-containing protein n=1 Tax=Sphaerisporangium fuscum TaxID=2835868 RepID=UPI001BDCA92D|nr:serine hydrolase domain-containing protein [Sphaerisporangium fuscum]